MKRTLPPALALLLQLTGCAGATVSERGLALQEGKVGAEEIARGMSDPDWHLRCLAARACGATTHPACMARLSELMINDADERVQACSLRAVAARCDTGERAERLTEARDLLGRIAWQPGEGPGPIFTRAFADAVVTCPSADAALTLATAKDPAAQEAFLSLLPGRPLPTGPHELASYLGAVARLPPPRSRTEAAVADAQARSSQLAEEEAAQRAREASRRNAEAEARVKDEQARKEAEVAKCTENAVAAIRGRDAVVAASYLAQVEQLGADATPLRRQVEKLKLELAAEHLARGWQLVRKDQPTEAELELREAGVLGGWDQRMEELEKAIAKTPSARRRRAEAERAERQRVIAEARQRAEIAAEELGDWMPVAGRTSKVCTRLYQMTLKQRHLIRSLNLYIEGWNNKLGTNASQRLTAEEEEDAMNSLGTEKQFVASCITFVVERAVPPCREYSFDGAEGAACFEPQFRRALAISEYKICQAGARTEGVKLWCGLAAETISAQPLW